MTEQEAIDAVLNIKEFCRSRKCSNGKHDICPFLDRHKVKHQVVCVISDKFPADWDTKRIDEVNRKAKSM